MKEGLEAALEEIVRGGSEKAAIEEWVSAQANCDLALYNYRFDHVRYVVSVAKEIAQQVGADEQVVTLAAWLHDIAKPGMGGVQKHGDAGAERAREILGLDKGDEDEEEISEVRCPNCNSDDVRYERWSSRGVFGSWLLLHFPLPILKGTWHCRKCGHEWKPNEEANVEHLCHLADTHADESNWDDAIRLYKVAIELDPSNSDLHNSLGVAYEEYGQAEKAEQTYRQAIAFDSENSMAYYNLGTLYEEQRRIPEAIGAFKECLRCSSDPDERTDVTQKLKGLETRTSA